MLPVTIGSACAIAGRAERPMAQLDADLTVTTSAVVAMGDMIIVEGPLTVNKDFGAGYKYDAIIEGAKVIKE